MYVFSGNALNEKNDVIIFFIRKCPRWKDGCDKRRFFGTALDGRKVVIFFIGTALEGRKVVIMVLLLETALDGRKVVILTLCFLLNTDPT